MHRHQRSAGTVPLTSCDLKLTDGATCKRLRNE
nr:MAG TPA: hypothetical protein [Caudoviricetes sp.]